MFPALEINLRAIKENTERVVRFCEQYNIRIVGVTKGVCGDVKIAKSMLERGIKILGDYRLQNIIKMKKSGIEAEFMLIRSPMISEIKKLWRLLTIV